VASGGQAGAGVQEGMTDEGVYQIGLAMVSRPDGGNRTLDQRLPDGSRLADGWPKGRQRAGQ
jgi:hypothetical protein